MTPTGPTQGRESPYFVGALQRAFSIVDFLAAAPSLEAGVSQIADGLGLPRPTVHRLLANLEAVGYVSQRAANGTYQLGLRLLELGNLVAGELTLVGMARPHLERLRDETSETTHLAVLDGRFVVYIDKVESERAIRMVSRVGARLPAHCTALGKAMLAFRSDAEVTDLLDGVELEVLTDRSASNLDEVRARLADVRTTGVALDDEEVERGLRCIGAPIADRAGTVVAAISLSAPALRLQQVQMQAAATAVKRAAAAISADLGFRGSLAIG